MKWFIILQIIFDVIFFIALVSHASKINQHIINFVPKMEALYHKLQGDIEQLKPVNISMNTIRTIEAYIKDFPDRFNSFLRGFVNL